MELKSLSEEVNYNEFCKDAENASGVALYGSPEELKQAFSQYLFDKTISFIIEDETSALSSNFMGLNKVHIDDIVRQTLDTVIVLICGNSISKMINKLRSIDCKKAYVTKNINTNSKLLLQNDDLVEQVRNLLCDDKSFYIFNSIMDKRIDDNEDYSDICEDNCYFNEIFENSISEEETYLDLGTLNIDTISSFIHYVNNKYKKIHAFEPTRDNYNFIKNALSHNPRISVHPYAVSDIDGEVTFFNNPNPAGNSLLITTNSSTSEVVKSIALDDFINEEVTFIKMDIEGVEKAAINGAERLIKKYKPKLAISIYHKPFDLLEIPFIIHTLVPEYKLFIRHHCDNIWETVLYAYI